MTFERAWYLVFSKPKQERLGLENLERQGYQVHLPLVRCSRRRQKGLVDVGEPMFPRYLFIHLSDQVDDWGPIGSTLGIMWLIRFGSVQARVPDDFMDALRACENEGGSYQLPQGSYERGDSVVIAQRSMAGYEAVFAARTGKERALLLLNIAGKEARVQLPLDQIESVGQDWR